MLQYASWGPRVGLTTADGRLLVGHLNFTSTDLVEIRTDDDGEFVSVPRDQITRLRRI
jgi:hypothetical protein